MPPEKKDEKKTLPVVGPQLAGEPSKTPSIVVNKTFEVKDGKVKDVTPAKVLQGQFQKQVDLNPPQTQPKGEGVFLDLRAQRLDDTQFAALQKAIIIAGAISGLLASGRIPNSPTNLSYLDSAVKAGLERV